LYKLVIRQLKTTGDNENNSVRNVGQTPELLKVDLMTKAYTDIYIVFPVIRTTAYRLWRGYRPQLLFVARVHRVLA